MNYPVNFNPFEKGYQGFKIERLASIYIEDLPWKYHHMPIHPSQASFKDYEFEGQKAIFSDHYVFLDTALVSEELRAECKYRGHFIKVVYRITATYCIGETILGEALSIDQARSIVDALTFTTGTYSRAWEISQTHIQKDVLDSLKKRAQQLSKSFVENPFLMNLFILDNDDDEGDFDLGIRLNRTPWTDDHLLKVTEYDQEGLRDSLMHENDLSAEFIDLMLLAGQADVRILIFSEKGKVLETLPTFSKEYL